MKRILLISATIVMLIVTAAFAAQRTRGELSNHAGARNDDEASSAGLSWEYLVVGGGNVNLSGNDGFSSMRKADGSFREAYPLERNLDKLGAKGWELVAVLGNPADPVYYLKRRKEPGKKSDQ